MLNDQELERATFQLEELRQHREQYQKTHTDVLEKYSHLIEDYKRLKSDYEEERDSRERYKQMARGQERNPFVLVLVDGDGYVFDDDLMSQGKEGGQRAAQLLNDAVKDSLRNRELDHCRIMVRVYANLAGLSKAVSKTKLCGPEKRSLAPFSASFTRSNDLFDFVDAGDLKENADYKIRAMFRQFVENAQCRHVFFAACHDVGYVSELTPYIGNRDRITLVRNHAFHHEFAKLGLRSEEFPHVFRTSPLSPLVSPNYKNPPTQPAAYNTIPSVKENAPICLYFQKGICKYGIGCRNQHIKPVLLSNSKAVLDAKDRRYNAQNNSTATPYQTHGSPFFGNGLDGGHPVDLATTLPRREDIPEDCIAVNKSDHRLDPYIPLPTSDDRALFYTRHGKHKLCNNHHLNGYCATGDVCPYDHTPVPPGVLNCLRQVAGNTPCPKRGTCRSLVCSLGHICQRADCRYRAGKAPCKFPGTAHSLDLAIANLIPGNNVQREHSLCVTDRSWSPADDSPLSPKYDFINGSGRLHTVSGMSDSESDDSEPSTGVPFFSA